jgi:acetyl-CoA synthetase
MCSMLACARLGVIHSEVFGGFSGVACGERIADSSSRILVTMDGYYRNGELIDHKTKADEALAKARELGSQVDKVLVWRRHRGQYASKSPMVPGRDFFVDELLGAYRRTEVEPVSMPAEAPLFLMYTSGTTARPKGCQHSTGGYLAYVTGTSKYYQDIHPEDTYWCFADIGWITGHSYIVYGPLSLGTTSVMYEGVPAYPDPGRPWRIAERLGVTIFHTAPTTIRMLRKLGPDEPTKYNYRLGVESSNLEESRDIILHRVAATEREGPSGPPHCGRDVADARLPRFGRRVRQARRCSARTRRYGRMFWLRRNRFVGSNVRLSARSRSYFGSP